MGVWWDPVRAMGLLFVVANALASVLARIRTRTLGRILQWTALLFGVCALATLPLLPLASALGAATFYVRLILVLPLLVLGLGQFLPPEKRKRTYRTFFYLGMAIAVPTGILLWATARSNYNEDVIRLLGSNASVLFGYINCLIFSLESWKEAASPAELWLRKVKVFAERIDHWWDHRAKTSLLPAPVNDLLFQTTLGEIPKDILGTAAGEERILSACRKFPQIAISWKTAYFLLLERERYADAILLLDEARAHGFDDLGFSRALAYAMSRFQDPRWRDVLQEAWDRTETPDLYPAFYFDVENDPAEIWNVKDPAMADLRQRLRIAYTNPSAHAASSVSTIL